MRLFARLRSYGGCGVLGALLLAGPAQAQSPSAEQALTLEPRQKGVEYDRLSPEEAAKATIKAERIDGKTGWVVRDAQGQILRKFVDTNADNVVDQWSYYLGGIEVYRDIDGNFNGKADEYRWLNTAGIRWGVDADEDGRVDSWKMISAEEVAQEAVQAMAARDTARFQRLLLSIDEIKALGLGESQAQELAQRVAKAPSEFQGLATKHKGVTMASWSDSRYVHFGGSRPGLVPAGSEGSTKDLVVYENVVAMIEGGGQHNQVQIGTMIKVGDTWKLIDVPEPIGDGELAAGSFFFKPNTPGRADTASGAAGGAEGMQKLLAELESLDKETASAAPAQQPALIKKRLALLETLAESAGDADERAQWLRNLADTINASVEELPDGVARLKAMEAKLKADNDKDLLAYVRFRRTMAEYSQAVAQPGGNFALIHSNWLKDLEQFTKDFPSSNDAAEAMLQLAAAEEFSGQEDAAKKWYEQIAKDFPQLPAAATANGALTRLGIVGKVLNLKGPNAVGGTVDLTAPAYRGKVVLIHYWATWCGPCKTDMNTIREMLAKYGSKGFAVVGISCDNNKEELTQFLQQSRVPWAHIYEPGGLSNRLANALGVQTLPTMLLLDKQGRVVNRNIHVTELDREIGGLLR